MKKFIFNSGEEMLNHIVANGDLYNIETGAYVYLYNENNAICCYCMGEERAKEIAEHSDDFWDEYIPAGGKIYDHPSNFSYCNDNYNKGVWVAADKSYLQPLTRESALENIKNNKANHADWELVLSSMKGTFKETDTNTGKDINWGFYPKDLKILADIHKKGIYKEKISYLLEDCNFHKESSLFEEGNYKEAISWLKNIV